jgi:hypothetical protein
VNRLTYQVDPDTLDRIGHRGEVPADASTVFGWRRLRCQGWFLEITAGTWALIGVITGVGSCCPVRDLIDTPSLVGMPRFRRHHAGDEAVKGQTEPDRERWRLAES